MSIIAVLWHHAGYRYYPQFDLGSQGFLGVDLFFAISGFLIATLLLREREETGRVSLRDFCIRRSLRIFPLYYAMVAVYALAVLVLERDTPVGREFMANLPFFLTYTSNWFVHLEERVIFYFAWSLAVEEQFYLVWPAVERFFTGLGAVALIGVLLALRGMAISMPQDELWVVILSSIHPAILGGVLLAHGLHSRRSFDTIYVFLGSRWAAPALLGFLLFAMTVQASRWTIWAGMVLFAGAAAIREDNGLRTLLAWRPFAYIGTIAYGMYLMHMLMFNLAKKLTADAMLWFPLTVVLTIIAAGVSFRYYESWFLRLRGEFRRPHPIGS